MPKQQTIVASSNAANPAPTPAKKTPKASPLRKPQASEVTLQATGARPITVKASLAASQEESTGDGRSVRLQLYTNSIGAVWVQLNYLTEYPDERNVTYLHEILAVNSAGNLRGLRDEHPLDCAADWVRDMARNMLPPGAGHPVTRLHRLRQEKLVGILETLTLECLTKALAQIEEPRQNDPAHRLS